METSAIVLQAFVAASIFFVWGVRYNNIVQEFKQYGLPDSLRDLVGILKLTLALLLLIGIGRPDLAMVGGLGIAFLMACAFAVHMKAGTPSLKRIPSLTLLTSSLVIAFLNYRVLAVQG
jgi:hypothetical protein